MSSTITNLFGKQVARPLKKGEKGIGCFFCPLNNQPGIHKIKGLDRIKQRRLFIWLQCPGKQENLKQLEAVGPAGRFLWETLALFGIKREDCDLNNVVRCRPTDKLGNDRTPDKNEIRCCSIYNEQALELNQQTADVHLICGDVAGKALLKKAYRKDTPIFWHAPWNAYVVINSHPSYVLRLGGKEKAGWAYYTFRDRMRGVKAVLETPGRFGYTLNRDYGSIDTPDSAERLLDALYEEASAGRRVSVDLEDGIVDGKKVPLMLGFGWGHWKFEKKNGDESDWHNWEGGARSVLLEHPENKKNFKHLPILKERLAQVIEDINLKKVFQHGSYDQPPIEEYFGVKLAGYDFDSQYGAFLRDSTLRKYSLENLIKHWFLEFGDYKTQLVKEWHGNFAEAPLSKLVPYNCADCEVTKKIEAKVEKYVSLPLLQTYILDAFTLDEMENHGPFLDWPEHARLEKAVPLMLAPIEQQLKILAGDENFNPGTPAQVAHLLFDILGLPELDGRSTQKETLALLFKETGHPACKLVGQCRTLNVIRNTFLPGYAASAKLNRGMLLTIWWLTGAATGRLRSGKSGEAEREGIINMQNTHGNPLLQNMIVSDPNWRLALKGKLCQR